MTEGPHDEDLDAVDEDLLEGEAPTVGEPEPDPHQDDGLDLARAIARAAARSTPPSRGGKKRRRDTRTPRGRVSGAHPDERDPQLLDSTLGRLVADHGWALDLRVHGVFGRWAELVGTEVAGHCTPETFADGKLVVRTDSTAWATQLRLLAPTIVRRLNEELGHGTVAIIEVLGPHGPTWKKGPRSVRDGRGPRDTYG
ncbi:MAG: DUF721 domain-containing protein [Nocardioides sp.]